MCPGQHDEAGNFMQALAPAEENLSMRIAISCCWGIGLAALLGACNGTPTRVEPPRVDPEEVAERAIERYDRDGDGLISEPEAQASPPLHYALRQKGLLDTNGDDRASRPGSEAVRGWYRSGVRYRSTAARWPGPRSPTNLRKFCQRVSSPRWERPMNSARPG